MFSTKNNATGSTVDGFDGHDREAFAQSLIFLLWSIIIILACAFPGNQLGDNSCWFVDLAFRGGTYLAPFAPQVWPGLACSKFASFGSGLGYVLARI